MDKSSTEYKGQADWKDYAESEEISVHLAATDNESNDGEILPRKRKRKFNAQFFICIVKSYRKGLNLQLQIL